MFNMTFHAKRKKAVTNYFWMTASRTVTCLAFAVTQCL